MTVTPPLRVVIVHWNQPEACLGTVARFGAQEVPVRITVVDNASRPAAVAELRAGLAEVAGFAAGAVELVEVGANTGFGPGANVGLRQFLDHPGDGDWVVLAPHDVDPFAGCLSADAGRGGGGSRWPGSMCADVGDGMVPVIDPYFGGMTVLGRPGARPRRAAALGGRSTTPTAR